MNKLLVTKDLNNKIQFGPSTSIINELNDKKNDKEKIYILDHCSTNKTNLNDKKINFIIIKNFLDLTKKIQNIFCIVKNSNKIEIHCIFDALLFFPLIIILKILRKEFKIYLRGMVNDNVLTKKKVVKLLYLFIAKPFINRATIIYTSKYEKNNSIKFFKNNKYLIINNIINNKFIKIKNKRINKKPKQLKILFFSNIFWKKNFQFVYKVLKDLNFRIELNIYGKCFINKKLFNEMIFDLRQKHKVNYHNYYSKENKSKIFFSNHILFLPTIDENFGHAIVENFLHYRPCLLSNNTPWNDNGNFNAGNSFSLKNKKKFLNCIKDFYFMESNFYKKICNNSKKYILKKLKSKDY
jgi:hypothetical protein